MDASPSAQQLWLFAGKLHPLVVHFPIALLVCALLLEFIRLKRGQHRPSTPGLVCIILGAASAIVAATLGWSGAETAGHSGTTANTLEWHRWLGVSTAGIAAATVLFAILARVLNRPQLLSAYRLFIVAGALLVGLTGHFGASLIYGPSYIADAWTDSSRRANPNAKPATPSAIAGSSSSPAVALTSTSRPLDFIKDIQPIFARRCYSCHAGEKPEHGLNLTTREGTLKGGLSGIAAVVPGHADDSRLIKLITNQEPGKLMPPKGGSLSDEDIATLRAWINQGAKWPGSSDSGEHWHWAYRPPIRPTLPAVKHTDWPRNPIDYFVLAKLESESLTPSPEADKEALIRRASLDLTGLPPTIAEIDAFLADPSPTAYDKVVDRLLASPHYGERWARPWLDLARYADTNGYEKDARRTIWPYRDWVINALNRDLPFDRFTIDQLAGDLLPNPTLDEIVATGFNRNTMTNEEGGVDPEEFRVEAVLDRVNTVSSVWLGSTVACAQCHDHKFDPISQREYFQLFAFFNQDEPDFKKHQFGVDAAGPMAEVAPPETLKRLAELRTQADSLKKQIEDTSAKLAPAQAAWEREQATKQPAWSILEPRAAASANGATLSIQPDHTILASGEAPETDTYTVEIDTTLRNITGLRLELLTDETASIKLVGRSPHGNIVLSDFNVSATPRVEPPPEATGGAGVPPASSSKSVSISTAVADHEQPANPGDPNAWLIAYSIDNDPKTGGWAVGPQPHLPHAAVFQFAEPIAPKTKSATPSITDAVPGTSLRITLAQNYGGKHTIAHFRLSATTDANPASASALNPTLSAALAIAPDKRSKEQADQIASHYRSIAPALLPLRDKLKTVNAELNALKVTSTLVMKKQPTPEGSATPRETHIHLKGSFLSPGDIVRAGTPAVLHQPAADLTPDRMGLARWITDPKNPLTARVTVNRFWEHYFGAGLVATSEDFGTQGEAPSHPELLDWLATEFPRQGWSMKAMHRLIVTSATYRQSSAAIQITSGGAGVPPASSYLSDPSNRLLSRGPRFRAEAEMVRDIALAASGLLSPKIGGPSVFPPQPPGTWTMIYNSDQWVESQGEDRYRRGLYTFWRRTAPYPTFANFDAPSRELACTRRPRTTTPLQALTTLNDPAFVEAAAALARRLIHEAVPDVDSRLVLGFRLCTSRRPSDAELARLRALYDQQIGFYSHNYPAATAVTGIGPAGAGQPYDPPEVAAWTVIANVLLNLDETLTKG